MTTRRCIPTVTGGGAGVSKPFKEMTDLRQFLLVSQIFTANRDTTKAFGRFA
jgi:hypothetical protein